MNSGKADPICLVLLIVFWIVAALLVNPVGDFPLNDDWAYGSAVRTLVEKGDLRFPDWTATNLIAQVLWGAFFCLPFGFSFTALRISTLVIGLCGMLATYGLLREARARADLAFLGALVLGFNPFYFSLSYTFMSDVPFTAVATASAWLLLRGLRRDSCFEIGGGLILAGVAILIRQIGLALPLAFAVAYVVRYGFTVRRVLESLIPVAAGLALQIGFETWLRWSERLPANFGAQISTLQMQLRQAWTLILGDAATITLYSLVYLGFFLFPFLVCVQRPTYFRSFPLLSIALVGIAAEFTAILFRWDKLMPLYWNILHKGGLGCCDGDPSKAPDYFWILITFISILGAMLVVVVLLRSVLGLVLSQENSRERTVIAFALAATLTTFAPLPLLGFGLHGFYDRYTVALLPWLMLTIAASDVRTTASPSRFALIVGTIMALGISVFSVAATHDYLSANRVRWAAFKRLLNENGIKPDQIEGGFEFAGLYSAWGVGKAYVVSYSQRAGYTIVQKLDVPRWLPWGRGGILVQSKANVP